MASILTVKSKWLDKPWHPEPGSRQGPAASYLHDGQVKHLSWAELQAGERVGSESYLDYAFGAQPPSSGRGGWELFEDRPGIAEEDRPDDDLISNGTYRWNLQDTATLIRLAKLQVDWMTIALIVKRTPSACRARWNKLVPGFQ